MQPLKKEIRTDKPCSGGINSKSKVLNIKNVDVYPHIGIQSRKVICFKSKLSVVSELKTDEEIESFILGVKSSILDKELNFNYVTPYSYGFSAQEKTISIRKLFEGKYNLTQNCVEVSLALAKLINENFSLDNSSLNMYISCIPQGEARAYKYKLDELNDRDKSLVFTHAYITFESAKEDVKLILDATTSNFSYKGDVFFGTSKELLNSFKLLINNPENYKFVGDSSVGLKVNRYIYDAIGDIDEIALELMKFWYGNI
ncbi:MAG: hypothetical protein GY920_18165 [Aliivibrio sp.]|nr:hypothetical protein [Aliivibrio sp.]